MPIPAYLSTTVAQRPRIAVGITHGEHGQGAVVVHGVRESITRAFSCRNVDEFGHGGVEGEDVFKAHVFCSRTDAVHRKAHPNVGQHWGVCFSI